MTDFDFMQFYDSYAQKVYRCHLSLTGDPEAAEGLTTDTFYAALQEITQAKGYMGQEPAVRLAALAMQVLRIYRRRGRFSAPQPAYDGGTAENGEESAAAARSNFQLSRIARAFRQMKPEQACAVALHVFFGLTLEETGTVLNRSAPSASALLRGGLAELEARLLREQEAGV
jgi:DNA-directed RNA polymerase specialized sigma24 family protein